MILGIDVGNTNIVFGGMDTERMYFSARVSTDKFKTKDEYAVLISNLLSINGVRAEEILSAPVEYAQQLAAESGACVLLKGATTVIACGEDLAMNLTGCSGMATGGSGDVLTGIIAGLMAQGMTPWDAARVGAYHHGLAGERAEAEAGARAVTAADLVAHLRIE